MSAKYTQALALFQINDIGGPVRTPLAVLILYEDGWRGFAQYAGLGNEIRGTSYTIDAYDFIKSFEHDQEPKKEVEFSEEMQAGLDAVGGIQ